MTFVPGRNIQDILLLAHKLIRGYNRNHESKRCALKVEIQGANDALNWRALLMICKRVGIPGKMIDWIEMSIYSARYSILAKWEFSGYFEGRKVIH